MSPLAKRVIVMLMFWVLLVMVMSQIYDNVTGKGAPAKRIAAPTPEGTVQPDQSIARLADLQGCVAADPKNLQCTLDLAALYYEAHQYPQAQVNYERAIRLDPHNVEVLLKLAGAYIYQDKFSQAVTTLQQAATLQPNSPEIHLLLGLSLSKSDPPRTDEAVAEWRKVIALAPGTDLASQASNYINQAGK